MQEENVAVQHTEEYSQQQQKQDSVEGYNSCFKTNVRQKVLLKIKQKEYLSDSKKKGGSATQVAEEALQPTEGKSPADK